MLLYTEQVLYIHARWYTCIESCNKSLWLGSHEVRFTVAFSSLSQNLTACLCHQKSLFKLSWPLTILGGEGRGDDCHKGGDRLRRREREEGVKRETHHSGRCPVVRPCHISPAAFVDHGLNGEGVAWLHHTNGLVLYTLYTQCYRRSHYWLPHINHHNWDGQPASYPDSPSPQSMGMRLADKVVYS